MASTFEKMNLKDQKEIVVLNAPASFERELRALRGVTVLRDLADVGDIEFSLAFVTREKEVDTLGKIIARKAKGDAVIWFAYPKGTSKKYKSEIGRDNGWRALGACGFECVRAVAIDEDWSGARFRRVEYVKTMKRGKKNAISVWGKARAGKK
jgi:hypothetical protein